MTCKACGLNHSGMVRCKVHAAQLAAQAAEDAKLLATVKPPGVANTIANKPVVANAPVANTTEPVANRLSDVAAQESAAFAAVVGRAADEVHKRYKDKDARRAYMRAYMAKRRT